MKVKYRVDGVPSKVDPVNLSFPCPIAKETNYKNYRITLDEDPIEGRVYFELGFGDNKEYDVSAFFNAVDAKKLASKLASIAETCIYDYDEILKVRKSIIRLKNELNGGEVSKVDIKITGGYYDTVFDTLFGKLTFTIEYVNIKHNMPYQIDLISNERYHKLTSKEIIKKIEKSFKKYPECEFVLESNELDSILDKMKDTMKRDGLVEVPDNAVETMEPKDVDIQKIVGDYLRSRKK